MGVSIIANTWVHFTEKFRRLFLHTHLNSHCEAQLLISVCSKWEDSLVKGSTQAASDDMTEHTPSMSDHHGLTRPRTESGISLTLWWGASCQLSQPYFQAPSCSKIKDKNVPQHIDMVCSSCSAKHELSYAVAGFIGPSCWQLYLLLLCLYFTEPQLQRSVPLPPSTLSTLKCPY